MPRLDAGTAKQWAEGELNRQLGGNYSGLDLTPAQRDQIIQNALPLYESDWNASEQGNAQVANALQQLYQATQTPEVLQAKQQAKWKQDAPKYYDQVNGSFQSLLGRDATDAEKSHFGTLLASGTTDPYQIQQILQQSTEYRNKADSDFRKQVGDQMQQSQSDYFQKYLLPSLQSDAANAGRSFDSSGYQNAVVQAGKQQNYDLQNYLAQLSASQYGGNVDQARSDYNAYLSNAYNLRNASSGYAANAANQYLARNQELQDYQTQQAAYQSYLSRYGRRSNGLGGIVGGLAGAGLGGYFGGAQGAGAGYQIGAGLGNATQNALI